MEKQLIYTDTRSAERVLGAIDRTAKALNDVYSEFAALDVRPTLKEIFDTVEYGDFNADRNMSKVLDLLRNKLLDKINPTTVIAGVTLSRKKLAEMVELPDTGGLKAAYLELCASLATGDGISRKQSYYTTDGDAVTKAAGIEAVITEQYSYYATTPRQKELTDVLTTLADALNAHQATGLFGATDYEEDINGIIRDGGRYRPDHSLILKY